MNRKLLLFICALLLSPGLAFCESFGFLKPYEGSWWGTGTSNFGAFAINIVVGKEKKLDIVKYAIKINGKSFDGKAILNETVPGKEYKIDTFRRKNTRDYKNLQVLLAVSKEANSHVIKYAGSEGTEKVSGKLVLTGLGSGKYKLDISLPSDVRLAGIPVPLFEKITSNITLGQDDIRTELPVVPALKLKLHGKTDADRKTMQLDAGLAFYSISAKLRKKTKP